MFPLHPDKNIPSARCPDLEMYVKEVSPLKKNLLLINKADLLTAEQRETWSSYLSKQGLDFAFFSALEEEEEAAGEKSLNYWRCKQR